MSIIEGILLITALYAFYLVVRQRQITQKFTRTIENIHESYKQTRGNSGTETASEYGDNESHDVANDTQRPNPRKDVDNLTGPTPPANVNPAPVVDKPKP